MFLYSWMCAITITADVACSYVANIIIINTIVSFIIDSTCSYQHH